MTKTNKERFLKIVDTHIKREGIDSLMKWLEESDFYEAPASTRFHLSCEGGLLQHILNVYDRLLKLYVAEYGKIPDDKQETLAIIALFHDICKVNCYHKEWKNVKVYSDTGSKYDVGGKFDWEMQEGYRFDELFPYGYHCPKSIFLIERHIRLTEEEAVAVVCHMGFCDRQPNDFTLSGVFEKFPLAYMLHAADCFAAISEKKK